MSFIFSCHSIHTMEHEFYECPEYMSNTPAEVERTEEYEYEVRFCFCLFTNVYSIMLFIKMAIILSHTEALLSVIFISYSN